MFKGEFKTAWMQREIPMKAVVVNDMVVGELVKVTPGTGKEVPTVIEKLSATIAGSAPTEAELAAALAEATHIVAQSDMTLEYGHVPVEYRDYLYLPDVATTVDMTKLGVVSQGSLDLSKFEGYYFDADELPTATAADHTALVLGTGDNAGKLVKYITVADSQSFKWEVASSDAAYSIEIKDAIKSVALYAIRKEANDVIVYDGE